MEREAHGLKLGRRLGIPKAARTAVTKVEPMLRRGWDTAAAPRAVRRNRTWAISSLAAGETGTDVGLQVVGLFDIR